MTTAPAPATEIVAGTWDIDPVHSEVTFAVRHLMISKVRGRFGTFSGTLVTGENFLDSTVTAEIQVGSLDTGNAQRDAHVASADFLDATTHPTITYRSTGLRAGGEGHVVDGELTLHGVTRPVALDLEVTGTGPDMQGGTRVGFAASTTVSRREFGIDTSPALESGVIVVGDAVRIDLDIQAVLRAS